MCRALYWRFRDEQEQFLSLRINLDTNVYSETCHWRYLSCPCDKSTSHPFTSGDPVMTLLKYFDLNLILAGSALFFSWFYTSSAIHFGNRYQRVIFYFLVLELSFVSFFTYMSYFLIHFNEIFFFTLLCIVVIHSIKSLSANSNI